MGQPGDLVDIATAVLDSHARRVGTELVPRTGDAHADAKALHDLDAVVLSHDGGADPHFVYANAAACELWRMPMHDIVGMASRLSAPPDQRDERASMLSAAAAADNGVLHGYSGIRVASDGTLFVIEDATLWTVDDYATGPGQAVVFRTWHPA